MAAAAALSNALASGAFEQLAPLCDAAELEAGSLASADWPHALHVLGHVVNNELEAARLVWKRLPASAKEADPELAAVWALLQTLWTRDYAGVGAALASAAWRPATAPVVAAVAAGHRARTLTLLSSAYNTVSLVAVASFLALPEPDALAAVLGAGWTQLPGPGGWLQVAPPPAPRDEGGAPVDLQALMAFAAHMS